MVTATLTCEGVGGRCACARGGGRGGQRLFRREPPAQPRPTHPKCALAPLPLMRPLRAAHPRVPFRVPSHHAPQARGVAEARHLGVGGRGGKVARAAGPPGRHPQHKLVGSVGVGGQPPPTACCWIVGGSGELGARQSRRRGHRRRRQQCAARLLLLRRGLVAGRRCCCCCCCWWGWLGSGAPPHCSSVCVGVCVCKPITKPTPTHHQARADHPPHHLLAQTARARGARACTC